MSGTYWVTEPNQYLEPKIAKTGFGSRKPTTVVEVFKSASEKFKNLNALALKRPVDVSSSHL